ncbi:MAG: retropepsin-like aspartic protease family protein [Aureispira sp.]
MFRIIITLLIILGFTLHIGAQPKVYTIPFVSGPAGTMEVDVDINTFSRRFIFDTGSSSISFGKDFLEILKNNNFITDNDIIGKTKTKLANGDLVDALVINLKTIELGNIKLQDVEALVIDKSDIPFLLGQNILNQFGVITIDNNKKEITIKNTPRTKPVNTISSIDELKIIACNSMALSKIDEFEQKFTNVSLITIHSITKETAVPPINARKRLINTLVIRFFDKKDKQKATILKNILVTNGFQDSEIDLEDMTPYYKTTLSGYLEIWTNK